MEEDIMSGNNGIAGIEDVMEICAGPNGSSPQEGQHPRVSRARKWRWFTGMPRRRRKTYKAPPTAEGGDLASKGSF